MQATLMQVPPILSRSTITLDFVLGTARFVGERTVQIRTREGAVRHVRGRDVVINTGTTPALPDLPPSSALVVVPGNGRRHRSTAERTSRRGVGPRPTDLDDASSVRRDSLHLLRPTWRQPGRRRTLNASGSPGRRCAMTAAGEVLLGRIDESGRLREPSTVTQVVAALAYPAPAT
jgi:hypothetical protein